MSLDSSMSIASDGLSVAATRMQIHANNIANTDTPYFVRKVPVLAENDSVEFEDMLGQMRNGVLKATITNSSHGVVMNGVMGDPTPGRKVYKPGHPQADKDGYVTMSNVNVLSDIADATLSSRLYEANLAVVSMVKSMATKALEIGRQ